MGMAAPSSHRARPEDTSPEVWRIQNERWRRMSPADRLALCDQMSADVLALAEAGIRTTEPDISPERLLFLLTKRRYGASLAEEAFGPEPPR